MEGRTDAMDCIDPNLAVAVAQKTREELDLQNLRGKFTGTSNGARQGSTPMDAGDGAAHDGYSTAKGGGPPKKACSRIGGSDTMTVNQASGSGTTVDRIKSMGNGHGVVLDTLFPLPSVHEWGPRPQGATKDARRT